MNNENIFTARDRQDIQDLKSGMEILINEVCGDKLDPQNKPGLLAVNVASSKVMYGDPITRTPGVLLRLERVEENVASIKIDKIKIIAVAGALTTIGSGAAVFVGWLLVHFKVIPI